MRMIPAIEQKIEQKMGIRLAYPSEEYLEIMIRSEHEFRKLVEELETDPLFQKLVEEGYVRKTNFRGRIPSHLYEEYKDKQFIEFLRKYDIENKVDWQHDFFRDDARRRAKELAVKYKVPRGHLINALEYCRYLKRSWEGYDMDINPYHIRIDEEGFKESLIQPSQSLSEAQELIAELSDIMAEYAITEAEFTEYFLAYNIEPNKIANDFGIPLSAVTKIRDLVERMQILNSMEVNVVDQPIPQSKRRIEMVARVCRLQKPPRAEIQIDTDIIYNSRYAINGNAEKLTQEAADLIKRLRLINKRKSLTFRMVMFIFEYQYRYFLTGDKLRLKPLSQARISKEIGEHEATVSRILKDKYLDTPEGEFSLKFFCQSKGDVIHRLISIREKEELESGKRNKPFTDMELAEILKKEYDTKISRRTVTQHRNKFKDTPKFYERQRQK